MGGWCLALCLYACISSANAREDRIVEGVGEGERREKE